MCRRSSEAYHNLWGTERIGADEKALSTRTGRPLTDKWTFSTNGVSIQGRYGILRGLRPRQRRARRTPRTRSPGSRISPSARRSMPPSPCSITPRTRTAATSFRQELTGNDIK